MEEIFSLPPEQEPSGDSGAVSLDAQILSQVSWEIVSQDNNNVEIAVAAPDVKAILGSQATELLSQPDGVEQILALLNQDNLPMTSTTVSVTLDENGVPTDAFPLTDAIYGGLLSLLEEIYASMEASK